MAVELTAVHSNAVAPRFVALIPEVIAALSHAVADIPGYRRRWVFYGSMPLGAEHEDSDLDALLLHDLPGRSPHRRSARWGRRPVTVYVLSESDLAADSEGRRFGGYFALKLLSPFVSDERTAEAALADAAASFLGPWAHVMAAGRTRDFWSADQVLALAYLAFLDMYPDFGGYLARAFRDPVLLPRVWRHQRRIHTAALARKGLIEAAGPGWRYAGIPAILDPQRERARCAARFWAFGAVCHGADPGFPDKYFDKTDRHAPHREQHEAREVLTAVVESGGAPC